jgi:hypothetical protein
MGSPQLTFRPREGVLLGTSPGFSVRLTTARTASDGAAVKKLTSATPSKLEVFDYPGFYAKRFDGDDKVHPAHRGRAVLIRSSGGTVRLHGAPPCGHGRCIVILQDWDRLFKTLQTARQISLVVEL